MRYRHQEAVTKSVMLGNASQTSGVMQNVHDKPGNLPDPDIFTFDTGVFWTIFDPIAAVSAIFIISLVSQCKRPFFFAKCSKSEYSETLLYLILLQILIPVVVKIVPHYPARCFS